MSDCLWIALRCTEPLSVNTWTDGRVNSESWSGPRNISGFAGEYAGQQAGPARGSAAGRDTGQCFPEQLHSFRRGVYQWAWHDVLLFSAGPLRSIEQHVRSFLRRQGEITLSACP
jgi:hypothetical protein